MCLKSDDLGHKRLPEQCSYALVVANPSATSRDAAGDHDLSDPMEHDYFLATIVFFLQIEATLVRKNGKGS